MRNDRHTVVLDVVRLGWIRISHVRFTVAPAGPYPTRSPTDRKHLATGERAVPVGEISGEVGAVGGADVVARGTPKGIDGMFDHVTTTSLSIVILAHRSDRLCLRLFFDNRGPEKWPDA